MTSPSPIRIAELCEKLLADCDYPSQLFVIREGIRGKFMCQRIEESEKWAVSAYESLELVEQNVLRTKLNGVRDGVSGQVFHDFDLEIMRVSFDEARQVALGRPFPVVGIAIHLCDGASAIHYVR